MTGYLEVTIDKFTFRVAPDRWYTREGVWVQPSPLTPFPEGEGNQRVKVGLSDFLQQRSGDVAFAEIKPVGTRLVVGDEIASIETIKVTVALASPISGQLIEVNPALETVPEAINQDPYSTGWLAVIEPTAWDTDRSRLLDAAAYLDMMRHAAAEELP
ncbi:MAG TPA: glycine cleavage system protein H [Anaerolineae bacterium]|nr:glycine cleavage system protein H [Anaerolineae bacterium]